MDRPFRVIQFATHLQKYDDVKNGGHLIIILLLFKFQKMNYHYLKKKS